MPLETRNELFSVIGIDLPFVHGFPANTSTLDQGALQAILHKSAAVLWAGVSLIVAAALTQFHTAAPAKHHWSRTRFGGR